MGNTTKVVFGDQGLSAYFQTLVVSPKMVGNPAWAGQPISADQPVAEQYMYDNSETISRIFFSSGSQQSNEPGYNQKEIYAIYLHEKDTPANELSLIWRKPVEDSLVLFESEDSSTKDVEVKLTKPGYYRITVIGAGGGAATKRHNGGYRSHNTRKTYGGGSGGAVYGIINFSDIGPDGKILKVTVGKSGTSINNMDKWPNDDEIDTMIGGVSYIEDVVSCYGGSAGNPNDTFDSISLDGKVCWPKYKIDYDNNIFLQGDVPLLYDTYMYPNIVHKMGQPGDYNSQKHTKGTTTEDEGQTNAALMGEPNVRPKSYGGWFNGWGGSLPAGKTSWTSQPSNGNNGYVRIEYIYDENMIR